MIEKILFGSVALPGETVRIALAFLGTAAATYYDIFNNRNVPDKLLYAFLAVAFIANLAFYDADLFVFSIAATIAASLIGYVFYRTGQLGGADVFVIAAIMLLLPIHPSTASLPFNFPYIFSAMVFAGGAFAVYVLGYYGLRVIGEQTQPQLAYLLLIIPYLLFAYVYTSSFLFQPVYFGFVTLLFLATMFFMVYKKDLNRMLAEKMNIQDVGEEEVLALEMMEPETIAKYKLTRLLTRGELERLRATDIAEVMVFSKLPPFLPFLLLGMLLALFLSGTLILL